jgi:adenylylsulfate kinase
MIRELFPSGSFLEIFVRCDIEQCVLRDPKGLYRKAIGGEISDFTGISAPYEEPVTPELVVDTTNEEIESSVRKVIRFLEQRIV